ncbi:MAG TPA: hypothetical protein VFP20_07110 [Bacteroidales bacterium]|nr:hypothetical protein [Bacteroidales bacterium]
MITENPLRIYARAQKKDEAKLAIIRDYMENHLSPEDVLLKYHLNDKYLFYQWVGQYLSKSLSLSDSKEMDTDMKKVKDNIATLSDLEKDLRIKSLEKALEQEKLRSRSFEVMIDVAEKQLNIPIRKKAGTKQ